MSADLPLRILPLGGLGEIGLNCMVLEYDDEIIVLDCGVMFSDLQILGVNIVLPDMSYLKENAERIRAYVITHGHEDHIGALPFAIKAHPAPIYCTTFAQKLIESKLEEHGLKNTVKIHTYKPWDEIAFKHFKIKTVPVNHSIVEALSLFIDTPLGKIIFTGDFKIDTNPFYGKPFDSTPFIEAGKEGVLLLMSDSTNVERDGHSASEEIIQGAFDKILEHTDGLTIVAVFASNIARIGQLADVAKKHDLKIALLGRGMEQNVQHALHSGYLKGIESRLISIDQIENYDRKRVVVISTGSQGEYRSGLFRVAANEHPHIKLGEGDLVVMSSKFIPGNEKAIGRVINNLFKQGADVLYESVANIHVSGHANAEELRQMIRWTKPKFFIPVHGEYRHLVKHQRLAISEGIPKGRTRVAINGDVLELTHEHLSIVDHREENRVLIEGEGGKDISKVVLKDRKKVAETGIVFTVLIRNALNNEIVGGPDLFTRGFVEESVSENLIEDSKEVLLNVVEEVERNSKTKNTDLQEEIRIQLRRFYQSRLGRKPVVVPIVIDV